MEDKNTFLMYRSDIVATRRLKDKYGADSALEFLFAIAEYSLNHNLLPFTDPSAEDAFIFADIQRRVDADTEKYASTIEKRRRAGQRGGVASGEARSKTKQNEANEANASTAKQNEANEANASTAKQNEAKRSKTKQNEANEADTVSDTVSVSVSDTVSVSGSVNNSLSLSREGGDAKDMSFVNTEASFLNTNTPLNTETSPLNTFHQQQRPTGGATIEAPPTIEAVLEYAKMIGCPEHLARKFFHHYEANGWVTDGDNPRPFKWQSKLAEWKVAEEAKARTRHTDASNNNKRTNKLNVNDEYNDL